MLCVKMYAVADAHGYGRRPLLLPLPIHLALGARPKAAGRGFCLCRKAAVGSSQLLDPRCPSTVSTEPPQRPYSLGGCSVLIVCYVIRLVL